MRNQALLDGLSMKRRDPTLRFLTSLPVMLIVGCYLTYVVISWLLRVWPLVQAGDWAQIFQPVNVTSYLFNVGFFLVLVYLFGQYLAKFLRFVTASKGGREGVHWGAHEVSATHQALTVRLSCRCAVYRWPAILELRKTRRMLFLMLTPRSAVAIPCSAFEAKGDEEAFCAFVQEQLSGA